MSIRIKQLMAAILAASAALVGGWATLAPHDWYLRFPGLGHHWVISAGPYDEHLVRDVGGLYLALLVVSVWAIVRGTDELLRLTGAAWTIFSLPHLIFHATHLDGLTTVDKVAETGSLALTLLLGLALLIVPARR